jgi:hypothetical protein
LLQREEVLTDPVGAGMRFTVLEVQYQLLVCSLEIKHFSGFHQQWTFLARYHRDCFKDDHAMIPCNSIQSVSRFICNKFFGLSLPRSTST